MASAGPRRALKLAGRGLLGLALLLAAGLAFLRTELFSRYAAGLVEQAISAATGERALVGGVRVEPLARRVSIEGLVISHIALDPAEGGRTVAAVERITAVFRLEDWRPRLALLEVVRPVLRLHLDADGLRELRNLPSSTSPDDSTPLTRFPWDELRIRGANAVLEGQGFALEIEGLDASPEGEAVSLDIARLGLQLGALRQAAYGVHLGGIIAAPDRVAVPDIDLILRPDLPDADTSALTQRQSLRLSGAAALAPNGGLSGDISAELELAALSPLTTDVSYEGRLRLDTTLGGTLSELHLAGAFALDGASIAERSSSGYVHTYLPGDITAGWQLDGPVLTVHPLVDRVGAGVIEVHGTLDLRTMGLMAGVTAESVSLAHILVAASAHPDPWVDFQADLEAQVGGTLSPLDLAGSFEVDLIRLEVGAGPVSKRETERILDMPMVTVEGELRLLPNDIRLRANRIRSGSSWGTADATIGFGADGPLSVHAELDPIDLALVRPLADVNLEGVGRIVADIGGPFSNITISGTADVDQFAVLDIPFADRLVAEIKSDDLVHLELPRFDALLGQTNYSGRLMLAFERSFWMDLQILISHGRLSDVVGLFLDAPGLDGEVSGMITLEGDPYRFNGEGDLGFTDVDLFGEHFETGFARGWMDDGRFTLDDLVLTRRQGAESVLARGTVVEGWKSHFDLVSGGLRLERMDLVPDGVPVRGELALDARVGGTLFEPEPEGRLALRETWLTGERVADSTIQFDTHDGVLRYSGAVAGDGLALRGMLGLWDDQPYSVHADLQAFPLQVVYPVAADGGPVVGRATGVVDIKGAFGDSPTPVDIAANLSEVTLSWGGHTLTNPGPWLYTQHGLGFKAEGVELVGDGTSLSFGGWRAPDGRVAFSGGGTLDLDLLRAVVPDLQKSEGLAQVQLSLFSPGGKPLRPIVEVEIPDATIRTAWFPHPFEGLSASMTLSPDGYDLRALDARLGGGVLHASGRIDAKDWLPVRYDLVADAADARVRYLDYLPPMVADAHLRFDGPANALLMSGQVDVKSMIFADRIDWESWVLELSNERLTGTASEATADLFSFDLTLNAKDTIRMHNNVGDLTASADLRVVGDTSRTGLVGDVRVDPGGTVFFQDREFELNRGELRFTDPYTYDPELSFEATADVRGREQEYQIDVSVDGLYSDWRTTAVSDPPLSQSDINSLLVFGLTREELERYGGLPTALALEGGDLLAARFGLVERVGEGIFQIDLLHLDRVDLVSGVSERGAGTVSSEVRLIAEKDLGWDTRLLLEQNLSRTTDSYVALEKRLARTLYARSYWASLQYGRSLPIGGAYGVDFKLRWELY